MNLGIFSKTDHEILFFSDEIKSIPIYNAECDLLKTTSQMHPASYRSVNKDKLTKCPSDSLTSQCSGRIKLRSIITGISKIVLSPVVISCKTFKIH